jgi:hypothetical protein
VVAGDPGTGGAAGHGNTGTSAGYAAFPQTFVPGTPIVLDSASPLYSYLNGQGVLRTYQQGADDVSHAALANLMLAKRQPACLGPFARCKQVTPKASKRPASEAGEPSRLRTGQERKHGASRAPACDALASWSLTAPGPGTIPGGKSQEHPVRLRRQIS